MQVVGQSYSQRLFLVLERQFFGISAWRGSTMNSEAQLANINTRQASWYAREIHLFRNFTNSVWAPCAVTVLSARPLLSPAVQLKYQPVRKGKSGQKTKTKPIYLNCVKAIQLKFSMMKLLWIKFHKISMLVWKSILLVSNYKHYKVI